MDSTLQDDAERKAALEAGRLLFAQECGFVAATTTLDRLPPDSLPEIAFAGRSNVGKSSLINALTGRKTLARTSNTPGRTQQLNFFDLGHRLLLVDLPGHGFAKVSKTQVRDWTRLVKDYLRGRVSLRRVCLLVDARHGLKDNDREVMALMDQAAVVYQVVLTKTDKTKPAELQATLDKLAAELSKRVAAYPVLFPTSAVNGEGIPELRAELATLALQP
ncbi:ribosome biogenesis GTP-binding protein YihA/YsxC [Oceanibaculum sp.]|uniref:ribosome biogenesis GTP-binding protein YihA/YsxC n=1 Tax=Oceanibaculum sp. TaxID=1903597 RepID=UPI002585A88C|nr:ribosome biogenesis GTP-binding protein YihA/YsxC [Oceanibaculum sp.]MCH2393651.1 ribosome biogenesis GTP-binding protein YihA/YsxC [Oceanibaculum sp.]